MTWKTGYKRPVLDSERKRRKRTKASLLIGRRVGHLVVIGMSESERVGGVTRSIAKCVCDCGTVVCRRADVIASESAESKASCGCVLRKDLTGARFGSWVVIRPIERSHSGTIWLCRCDCGTEDSVLGCNLAAGGSKSCGCWQRALAAGQAIVNFEEQLADTKLLPGVAACNRAFGHYKAMAARRGRTFAISRDEFEAITQSNCNYCGRPPSAKYKIPRGNGEYTYNGIDRVNNALGYVAGNVVPCCKTCNIAKSTMSVAVFLDWVTAVYSKSVSSKVVPCAE